MDGIEQTKEYYDARMTSKKGSMKATAPAAQETQKQTQVPTKPIDPPKPVQAFGQSNWVSGKCVKCKREFRGPPVDRQGGDPTKTWFKLFRACKSSDGSVGKFRGETKDVHQVEKVTSTDDHCDEGPPDVYGPCDYDETHGCYMVDVHRSDQERVTNQVLNVLTDGRTNKCIIDAGVIVDSGAAVTLTNLGTVDPRRVVENSTKRVGPPVIVQGVGGKPVKCTESCSMYMSYTDPDGKLHRFVLDNCYVCDVVRTPLVSASHLVSKGCEIHLTKTGHRIVFPGNTDGWKR